SRVWNYFINVALGPSVALNTIRESMLEWTSSPFSAQGNQLWKRLPAAIPWGLWKARNAIAFSGKTLNFMKLLEISK
ncbi:hypothetical protein MKW92_047969, partial [Papaver armeniacum]